MNLLRPQRKRWHFSNVTNVRKHIFEKKSNQFFGHQNDSLFFFLKLFLLLDTRNNSSLLLAFFLFFIIILISERKRHQKTWDAFYFLNRVKYKWIQLLSRTINVQDTLFTNKFFGQVSSFLDRYRSFFSILFLLLDTKNDSSLFLSFFCFSLLFEFQREKNTNKHGLHFIF